MNMVMVCEFCFATNLAQSMACGTIFMFERCTIPMPFNLFEKVLPKTLMILSLKKGKKVF